MAQSLNGYQIVLIIILTLNIIFWIFVICWRVYAFRDNRNTSRRYQRAIRELLNLDSNRETRIEGARRIIQLLPQSLRTQRNDEPQSPHLSHCDPPPPYEEAIKFPSVSITTKTNAISVDTLNSNITNDSMNMNGENAHSHASLTSSPSTSQVIITNIYDGPMRRAVSLTNLETLDKTISN